MRRRALVLALLAAGLGLAGCGGGKHSATPPGSTASTSPPPSSTPSQPSGAPPLQGEPGSAGTGDIPDNQVFLVFRDRTAGYSIKYPEGWAQQGAGGRIVFRDKNNIVRILIGRGKSATIASVQRELAAERGLNVTHAPQAMVISGARAVKVVYTTRSAPNRVTGKQVELTVDRYYLSHAGRTAVVDLGTPVGVDNVDAYRLMIDSFRWR